MRAESDQYRIIPATNTFDFLEPGSDGVYPLSFRLVRFPLPDGSSETLLIPICPGSGFLWLR